MVNNQSSKRPSKRPLDSSEGPQPKIRKRNEQSFKSSSYPTDACIQSHVQFNRVHFISRTSEPMGILHRERNPQHGPSTRGHSSNYRRGRGPSYGRIPTQSRLFSGRSGSGSRGRGRTTNRGQNPRLRPRWRSRAGNRLGYAGTGRRFSKRDATDEDIKRFLETVDESKGVNETKALVLLSSNKGHIERIIRQDIWHYWERLIASTKFALSIQTVPHLTSDLVKIIINRRIIEKCSKVLKQKIPDVPTEILNAVTNLIEILKLMKRVSDFPSCSKGKTFSMSYIVYIKEVLDVAKNSNTLAMFAEEIKSLEQALIDLGCEGYGDTKVEVDDQSYFVRTKRIFPGISDIKQPPDLRPVNINAGYRDFKEYMHTQFSLLREDFIGPLRKGIREFQSNSKKTTTEKTRRDRYNDIRVYDNVKILSLVLKDGPNYQIRLDISYLRNIHLESLKYGALVCLSNDNFATMLVGVVVESEGRTGYIYVQFDDTIADQTIKEAMKFTFTMIEPKAYFESYRHVLLKCKNMRQLDLPMERYIVQCQHDVLPPKYLRENPETTYDLTILSSNRRINEMNALGSFMKNVDFACHEHDSKHNTRESHNKEKLKQESDKSYATVKDGIEKSKNSESVESTLSVINVPEESDKSYATVKDGIEKSTNSDSVESTQSVVNAPESDDNMSPLQKVNVLGAWPEEVNALLDSSQACALRTALTKELSIIKGPPGCGKTYIGWQIVKVLLTNKTLWRSGKQGGPILVLCSTNHALDQFLEGIARSYSGCIVRVGGRSNSSALEPYNLTNIRSSMRKAKALPEHIYQGKKKSHKKVNKLKNRYDLLAQKIRILKENIVHEKALYNEMGSDIADQFCWRRKEEETMKRNTPFTSMMVRWLGINEIESDRSIDLLNNWESRKQVHDKIDQKSEQDENMSNEDNELTCFYRENIAMVVPKLMDKSEEVTYTQWKCEQTLNYHLQCNNCDSISIPPGSNINTFDIDKRWCIYRGWVDKKCKQLGEEIKHDTDEYRSYFNMHKDMLMLENCYILQNADVIGMTTTGAAKFSAELKGVNSKIVIIEEAAQILESHIVSNLEQSCDQLIMIGDHQQLRPKHNFHKLAKKFNFNISLFERLTKSGFHYTTLTQQHRMMPVIADNIRHIYPDVVDHPDVGMYEDVRGIDHNMIFFNHEHREELRNDNTSYRNEFEASFAISLAKYIRQQGYKPDQVILLTTYKEQMRFIKNLKGSENFLDQVRVAVVDDYQGEECDIVILSLVRNNVHDSIGFLKEDERVCVALSRAKIGLYVLGNVQMLTTPLWKKILKGLSTKDLVLDALPLRCQNHPDTVPTLVSKAGDFLFVPEGGCKLPCEYQLPCRHTCQRNCHLDDVKHENAFCRMPCERQCKNSHPCKLKCGQKCECKETKTESLPCGHIVTVNCDEDVKCNEKCDKQLKCGHTCPKSCMEQCYPCEKLVKVPLLHCGHCIKVPCHADISKPFCDEICGCIKDCGHECTAKCGDRYAISCDEFPTSSCLHRSICETKCTAWIMCGHKCNGNCSECFQGRLHKPCSEKCSHLLVCGHDCPGTCNCCEPCTLSCERKCPHRLCTNQCFDLCEPCDKPCAWSCPHGQCTEICGEPCKRKTKCSRRCPKILSCKHKCIGLCGDPCPPYCASCTNKQDEFLKKCFGSRRYPRSSFVLLEDCGHAVQYKLLDKYFAEAADLSMKQCPICSVPIYNCRRYTPSLNRLRKHIDQFKRDEFRMFDYPSLVERQLIIDSFHERLENISRKNLETLQDFIADYGCDVGSDIPTQALKQMLSRNTIGEIMGSVTTPSKQWMNDIKAEMYRYCDTIVLISVDKERLTEETSKRLSYVMDNLSSRFAYTAEKRKDTTKLVCAINNETGTVLELANISFKLSRDGENSGEGEDTYMSSYETSTPIKTKCAVRDGIYSKDKTEEYQEFEYDLPNAPNRIAIEGECSMENDGNGNPESINRISLSDKKDGKDKSILDYDLTSEQKSLSLAKEGESKDDDINQELFRENTKVIDRVSDMETDAECEIDESDIDQGISTSQDTNVITDKWLSKNDMISPGHSIDSTLNFDRVSTSDSDEEWGISSAEPVEETRLDTGTTDDRDCFIGFEPREVGLLTLSSSDYFKCRKAPFPKEFEEIMRDASAPSGLRLPIFSKKEEVREDKGYRKSPKDTHQRHSSSSKKQGKRDSSPSKTPDKRYSTSTKKIDKRHGSSSKKPDKRYPSSSKKPDRKDSSSYKKRDKNSSSSSKKLDRKRPNSSKKPATRHSSSSTIPEQRPISYFDKRRGNECKPKSIEKHKHGSTTNKNRTNLRKEFKVDTEGLEHLIPQGRGPVDKRCVLLISDKDSEGMSSTKRRRSTRNTIEYVDLQARSGSEGFYNQLGFNDTSRSLYEALGDKSRDDRTYSELQTETRHNHVTTTPEEYENMASPTEVGKQYENVEEGRGHGTGRLTGMQYENLVL